jgi:hypothetical protein
VDKEKLTKEDRKRAVNAAVARCHEVANEIIRNWKPLNSAWAIIDGCVYIRLSTDEQVIVERGSLEQQIFIAVSEAIDRSKHDQINYRISRFYIEPGITARNDRRPIFQEMKHKIANRMHGFIVIKEISRLSRELGIWKEWECPEFCVTGS